VSSTHRTPEEITIFIIGAGPAGLTAGYLLTKKGITVQIAEADPKYVGGISKTIEYKGYHFDIGGHRFFSKSKRVEDFWTELLPHDLLERPRSSRILYRGKLFSYPLKAFEALFNLGLAESIRCVLSYLIAKIFPTKKPRNFEEWTTNQFGQRLFEIFFKTYTEKVWGMDCKEISADWAAQRIKGLSLGSAILHALLPQFRTRDKTKVIKSLIDTFRYPRKGPGMLWEACAEKIQSQGGKIHLGHSVRSLEFHKDTQRWVIVTHDSITNRQVNFEADHIISSAPLHDLIPSIRPTLSAATLQAAARLRYRDFITVALMIEGDELFEDNWVYIHDPGVKVGRIQNFKSWSPEMVPNPQAGCYGLEYFCFEGDSLWESSNEELMELARSELRILGFKGNYKIVDGQVIRQPKAYPVYDDLYVAHVDQIRQEVEIQVPSLHFIGRNGMHKYNNQAHAIMTAMLTVENILAGKQIYDVWKVNQDAEYHETLSAGEPEESTSTSGIRQVPIAQKKSA
jgi:protoporphyrinogen oxidase